MVRPPRRRKQQQQQTGTKSHLLDSSLSNDEEYSFASSSAAASTSTKNVMNKKPSNKATTVPTHSHKSTSSRSRRPASEKENVVNADSRCEKEGDAVAIGRGLPQNATRTKHHTEIDSKSTILDPMEELSGTLTKLTIDRNITNESATENRIGDAEIPVQDAHSPFPPIGYGSTNITISVNDDGKPRFILQNALRLIEKSSSGEKEILLSLFQSSPAMVDAMASASWSLGPSEYMILEENSTKLLNIAKQCLKVLSSFTSTSSSSSGSSNATTKKSVASINNTTCGGGGIRDDDLELALLRVALYSLRSILPIVLLECEKDLSKLQVVIKLFYHCVVISGDACHRTYQAFTTSSSVRKNVGLNVISYALLCLGAYEGVGTCLRSHDKKSGKVIAWDEMLPVKDGANQATADILPQQQFVRIAMESTLCTSSCLLDLSLVSLRVGAHGINEIWTIPDEFHFATCTIVETCSGEHPTGPMFHQLLLYVAHPYVMQSLFVTTNDGNTPAFDADALRHVTKVFRILWDGASSVEEICVVNNSMALRMSCFELRKDAILFILRTLASLFARRLELPIEKLMSTSVKEVSSLFDRASLSALKSVGIFDKASGSIQEKKSALLHFHDTVGNELDRIAMLLGSGHSRQEKIPIPSSYYEYCVYRSTHLWRLVGSSESVHTPPYLCLGKSASRVSSKGVESLVGFHTFTIIHIVLRTLHHLKMDTDTSIDISDSDCQQAIANFELVVINNASPSSLLRCRSLLQMLDLHKEATIIISNDPTISGYDGKERCIATLASVIGNCFAPLDAKLSQSTKDTTKCLNFRLSNADFCVKSASLFGLASDVSTTNSDKREEYSVRADTQLRNSYDKLITELGRLEKKNVNRKAPPVLAIEMFAKVSAYAIEH
jgi:hypothetical protein